MASMRRVSIFFYFLVIFSEYYHFFGNLSHYPNIHGSQWPIEDVKRIIDKGLREKPFWIKWTRHFLLAIFKSSRFFSAFLLFS